MAVYRSDQAQFTFAAEAGPGGYPEIASGDDYTTETTSAASRPIYPGDKIRLEVDALGSLENIIVSV